ncbi:type VII secretion target [Nocardia sienata]|uniref:type VII secretion target n=1 Tax=Nocardia sienata TaxID=248552 RepID=UPI0007A4A739|nr:type VII secretion target [Nocardia sienata]
MTEPLDIDLDLLRELAIRHEEEADKIRARVAPPTEWLDSYLALYGNIALPVYEALLRYVDARQADGNALADTHQLTADNLRTAAWKMELVDQQRGRSIEQAVSGGGQSHSPALAGHFVSPTPAEHSNSPSLADDTGTAADSSGHPSSTTTTNGPAADPRSIDTLDRSATAATNTAGPAMAGPGPGFGGRGGRRETPWSRAKNTSDDTDLDLARKQLSTIINTAPDIPGLDWAVAVMRAGDLVQTFVTSNQGRGWLPAGAQFPSTMATPWAPRIANTLDGVETAWEGAADPARILVGFGSVWGARHTSRMTALVTTGTVDMSLHGAVPDAAVEGDITPGLYPIDTTARLVDRLGIYSSDGLDPAIDTVPDTMIRACVAGLASDAHARLGRRNRDDELHKLRERLLTRLDRGQTVPSAWWTELRHSVATGPRQHRGTAVFSGTEPLPGRAPEATRTLALELRAVELLLLLDGKPSRQLLRDAAYSYAQVVNHPLFAADSSAATPAGPVTITTPITVAQPPAVNLSSPATRPHHVVPSAG